jgi:hypothetical protein
MGVEVWKLRGWGWPGPAYGPRALAEDTPSDRFRFALADRSRRYEAPLNRLVSLTPYLPHKSSSIFKLGVSIQVSLG